MIASPSSTASLPDPSITNSSFLEENKTAVGKHVLPTVFIPQQKYTRVAMPLNTNCPNLAQENVEENLNPNYPNIGKEANVTSDEKFAKAKQPSGTVRRKMTIPVRRKSTVVDDNQRRNDQGINPPLQEMNHTSNPKHNGLDLLSSVCATRHEPPQEELNDLRHNQTSKESQMILEGNPYVIPNITDRFGGRITDPQRKLTPITDAAIPEMISPAYRRSTSWQPTTTPPDHFQSGYNRSVSMPPQRTPPSPYGRQISSMNQSNQPNFLNEINQFNKNKEAPISPQLWHQHLQLSKRHLDALKEAKMQQSNMVMPNRERSAPLDGNPQKYPQIYHNIPAQYHGVYHPAYYQPHMGLSNAPSENSQENLLANQLLHQQIAAQIRNQQMHQINEANRQNLYQSMYNNPVNVLPAQKNKRRSPPPYNGKHFVVNQPKHVPKEISKQHAEIQSSKQDQNQKCQLESIEAHPPPPSNQIKVDVTNHDKDNRNKSTNRLRQEFLDKIYVYQKYLTIQQFTKVLPKIPYSRDFSVYPYIVQEIEKIISNLPPPPPNMVHQNSDEEPSTYPLDQELVEKLLENEAITVTDVESKGKTPPNADIDNQNQVCTLYYESQDDKAPPEGAKQTVIIAEESSKVENVSPGNSLLKNGQNYATLLKLIDLVASTEHDRLLGQALLRYYPEEVLQITMARVDDNLSRFVSLVNAAEAKRQNERNLKCDQVKSAVNMPQEIVPNFHEQPVKISENEPKIQESPPKMLRLKSRSDESRLKTQESLPKIDEVVPKMPDQKLDLSQAKIAPTQLKLDETKLAEKTPKSSPNVAVIQLKMDGSKLKMSEAKSKIIEIGSEIKEANSPIQAQKPKSIPLSVIIQNPTVAASANKKAPNFSHRIENIVKPPPDKDQKDSNQISTIIKKPNNADHLNPSCNPKQTNTDERSIGSESNLRKGVIVTNTSNQKAAGISIPSPIKSNLDSQKPAISAKPSLDLDQDTECMMEAKELEVLLKETSPKSPQQVPLIKTINEDLIFDDDSSEVGPNTEPISEEKIFEQAAVLLREKPAPNSDISVDNIKTKNEPNSPKQDQPEEAATVGSLTDNNSSINLAQHDIRLIHEASETSFQTIQTSSSSDVDSCNSIPSISNQEINTETDSTDDDPRDLEIKREYMQYETKHLSHNFLFDVKFGPEDDIESIYARIMPSCFMILNLIHEMQNMNNINWWPVDAVGNLMKIKRSLRGIGTFLKRSKKLAAYLNPCIHHFFIFLLQCFGTFRERVKRILDNGFAMKENYISASEGDIYRDVFIQLYDYLCCNRVTEYANFVIKRDESVNTTSNKSDQNQTNQPNSFQPIKSFSSVHQKHMLIIEQLKQRRTAEEEKNEDFKNFISHLGNSNQMSSDDQNNNTQLDDVIIIPDAEDSNADSNPNEDLKRKIDLIIIDSDSEDDAGNKKPKLSNKKNTSYNIADIINLIDEDDLSSDNDKLDGCQDLNNKRQSTEDCSEMHKKFCGDPNLEMSLKRQDEDQSVPKETDVKNSDLQVDSKFESNVKNEAETVEKIETCEEAGKIKIDGVTVKTDIPQNEIKGENDQNPVIQDKNLAPNRNQNQNQDRTGLEDEVQNKNNFENVIKIEAQNKEKTSHDNSETIEAIQNYLRETDSIIQDSLTNDQSSDQNQKPNQTDSDTTNHKSNIEAKVIGVAIPNVKDTNSGNGEDSPENNLDTDGYVSDQNDDDSFDNKKKIIKEIYRHRLTKQKDNKTSTQKLIHFRKPSKHKDEGGEDEIHPQIENPKDLENFVPQEKSRRISQDIPTPIEVLPKIPNKNHPILTNLRRISTDQPPLQLKTRRISLEAHKNVSATNQQYNRVNSLDNSDSFNIQAKAAISEYFDAQRIVARQIAAPIHPDIALRNLESNSNRSNSTTTVAGAKGKIFSF